MMNQRRSADAATVLAAAVVLVVGLLAVSLEKGCRPSPDPWVASSKVPTQAQAVNR